MLLIITLLFGVLGWFKALPQGWEMSIVSPEMPHEAFSMETLNNDGMSEFPSLTWKSDLEQTQHRGSWVVIFLGQQKASFEGALRDPQPLPLPLTEQCFCSLGCCTPGPQKPYASRWVLASPTGFWGKPDSIGLPPVLQDRQSCDICL